MRKGILSILALVALAAPGCKVTMQRCGIENGSAFAEVRFSYPIGESE